eukprot:TRINITY_DN774039_c0_g1_i1.p1 TRINITY_DN774039_c0_g1~~TRINITY_DN774039_c0_g1_i1.p1  ORF type:complete len:102 (-),score=22.03 TRINITY_DN774039_c0_g1_i1:159-464(-)
MSEENPKVELKATTSQYSRTFIINEEDHTIGNSLRYVCMRDPKTDFCGYTNPHPSEAKINIRLQTSGAEAHEVLGNGLNTLKNVFQYVEDSFDQELDSMMQ